MSQEGTAPGGLRVAHRARNHLRRKASHRSTPAVDQAGLPSERFAAMLVGGRFLAAYVPDGLPWVHLDIAGPAFNDSAPHGYTPKGGTGAATRALVQIALDVAEGRL